MSTAFHQETNGQVERTNKTIMQMLRIYANSPGSNWAGNLWRVEHAHNTAKATWHDKSPFEMVHGHSPIEIPSQLPESQLPAVEQYLDHMVMQQKDSQRRSPPSTISNGRNCGQTTQPEDQL
jgi:hypothetical protein